MATWRHIDREDAIAMLMSMHNEGDIVIREKYHNVVHRVMKRRMQLRNAKRSYTCAKHSSLQTVDGATGVVGGGHTMHTYT